MEFKSSTTATRETRLTSVPTAADDESAAASTHTAAAAIVYATVDSSLTESENARNQSSTDLQSPCTSANSYCSSSSSSSPMPKNSMSLDRAHQQVAQRRARRNRKLIKSNLHLTLTDPEDSDSEENLASLDYSTNFMSINYPTTQWDNNNLAQNVLNEQNQSDSEEKSRYISKLNLPADYPNRYNLIYDTL